MRLPPSVTTRLVHPLLIAFALGLWIFSLICDGFFIFGSGDPGWKTTAYHAMAGGIAIALGSAFLALFEVSSFPTRTKKTILSHVAIDVAVAGLYALNLWQRTFSPDNVNGPVFLSALGIAVLAASGWLGGQIRYVGDFAASVADDAMRKRMSPQKSR